MYCLRTHTYANCATRFLPTGSAFGYLAIWLGLSERIVDSDPQTPPPKTGYKPQMGCNPQPRPLVSQKNVLQHPERTQQPWSRAAEALEPNPENARRIGCIHRTHTS